MSRLHVMHVTGSLSRLGGGVAPFVWELARRLESRRVPATVAGVRDRWTDEDVASRRVRGIRTARAIGPGCFGYAPAMMRRLRSAEDVDVIHAHGMWMHFGIAARKEARRRGVPLVISPHGSFEPWRLRQRAWRKRLGRALFENRNVRAATCLHATSMQEAANIRAAGIDSPVAVIPIGVDPAEYSRKPMRGPIDEAHPELTGKRLLLFASRIHPMKGLIELVDAWRELAADFPGWHLVIAGSDQAGYQASVEARAAAVGVSGRTSFVGPVYGEMKRALFSSCEAFVLPSHSENFGIVVTEALASARPVITTVGTPWRELREFGCGWWIETGTGPLTACLRRCMSLSDGRRREMGRAGRDLVERRYAWDGVIEDFIRVYRWAVGGGAAPACIVTDRSARVAA